MATDSQITDNLGHGATASAATVQIPVILSVLPRTGKQIGVGVIKAGDLIPRACIAHRDFDGARGYQRLPSKSRVNTLARQLQAKKVDLPTALLLSLRDFDPAVHLKQSHDGQQLLVLGNDHLWEVDGQHRCESLKLAMEREPDRFAEYAIPFVIGLGWSEQYEMEQFFVVNHNAKNVPTTIAYDILASLSQDIPGLMQDLEERGKGWQVDGQELAQELAVSSPIWRDRIRFSNEPKGMTTVPSAGFVNSLKPIVGSPYFGRLTKGVQVKVLDAYWEAQKSILPKVFESPEDYVLQKSLGVQVMHGIFNDVVEVVRTNGDAVTEPQSFVTVLKDTLENLSGDTRNGFVVSGESFWESGESGAAGAFSSSAGRRVLTARIKSTLPKIGVA